MGDRRALSDEGSRLTLHPMRALRSLSIVVGMGLAILLLQACGADPTYENSNGDTSNGDAATSEDQTETVEADSGATSFSTEVQPILEANCVSCHSNDGPGTTHLEMATAEDIASIAEFIAFRVEEKEMPPWPISPLTEIVFDYDLSMSDADRAVIVDWARSGAPLDVEDSSPLHASRDSYEPIDADAVVTAAEPYPGSTELDDYRCQVFDPELTEPGWIAGLEVRPDETRVLHHALIFIAPAQNRGAADALDGRDGRPGWECQTIPRLAGDSLFQAGGWAPGTGPIVAPDGSGFAVEPGDFLVVQWHYHYDGEALPDQTGVAIEYATSEEIAAAGGTLRPVENAILLAPVEIPCATHESGPMCSRDAAMARIASEFGFESAFIPELVNARCGVTPDDFAHMTTGVASSSCDISAPRGEVISIWPHMHELGTTYRMTLNPDGPDETILVDIDRWSFNWQMGYSPAEQLVFEAGDTLRIECGWDRALWPPGLESRYIVWAEGTQDEMCYTALALLR